jgi:tetratricopeptide (TPR) repeat protein
MLEVWLLLNQGLSDRAMADRALEDVRRVAADKNAGPVERAKAQCVQGLVLLYQGKLDEARPLLEKAVEDAPREGGWQVAAQKALRQLNDPVSAATVPAPENTAPVSPGLADEHFANGLRHYWARRYAPAEKEFLAAIHTEGRDARYYYFLGLTRWAQNRRPEARLDFERAAQLEMHELPGREAINAALERVQGMARQEVDQYRR